MLGVSMEVHRVPWRYLESRPRKSMENFGVSMEVHGGSMEIHTDIRNVHEDP